MCARCGEGAEYERDSCGWCNDLGTSKDLDTSWGNKSCGPAECCCRELRLILARGLYPLLPLFMLFPSSQ